MQTLLLALALLPTATAMGIYVPEGCMETPGGRVLRDVVPGNVRR